MFFYKIIQYIPGFFGLACLKYNYLQTAMLCCFKIFRRLTNIFLPNSLDLQTLYLSTLMFD